MGIVSSCLKKLDRGGKVLFKMPRDVTQEGQQDSGPSQSAPQSHLSQSIDHYHQEMSSRNLQLDPERMRELQMQQLAEEDTDDIRPQTPPRQGCLRMKDWRRDSAGGCTNASRWSTWGAVVRQVLGMMMLCRVRPGEAVRFCGWAKWQLLLSCR